MDEKQPIYITTTLPYVNASAHIGFAKEIIRADVLARYYISRGHEVFFNTGTDEHGKKIFDKAKELGKDTQSYVDELARGYLSLLSTLDISRGVHFIRTTDENHKRSAQELWRRCANAGYIYKKEYQAKYCVGCELFKTDSELEDGVCPLHPQTKIEIIDEENYFFKFSDFSEKLLDWYKRENPILPLFRQKEMEIFIKNGIKDFSISRVREKMPWGVGVPDDPDQVMYVWFDALSNYISTLGWPNEEGDFSKYWEKGYTIQIAGKDNLRQQSAMWQAILMAAGITPTNKIEIVGFINSGGQKMSKSLGNVIDPVLLVNHYGSDAIRYYLIHQMNNYDDSDVTYDSLYESYNAHLVNGLGNLANRILKLSETHREEGIDIENIELPSTYHKLIEDFDIRGWSEYIWNTIGDIDKKITETEPYKVVKTNREKGKEMIADLMIDLAKVARMIQPIMPKAYDVLRENLRNNTKPENPIFGRLEKYENYT